MKNVDQYIAQMLAFMALFLLIIGLDRLLRKRQEQAGVEAPREPAFFRIFVNEIDACGRWVESAMQTTQKARAVAIQNQIILAALTDYLTVRKICGAQALAALGLLTLGTVITFLLSPNAPLALLVGGVAAIAGWVLPGMWLQSAATRRQEAISKSLPYAIDLLTVALEAGQDFGAAVRFLVREGPPGPLSTEFGVMMHEASLGKSRVEALRAMVARIQLEEFQTLVAAVAQSTEIGAPLSETFKLQSEEIRRRRFHRAERKAARAPSIMIIPVAIFILPAVFLIILVPVGIRVMGVMSTMKQ